MAVWPISATWRTSRVDTWTFSSACSDIFSAIWLLEYIARQADDRKLQRQRKKAPSAGSKLSGNPLHIVVYRRSLSSTREQAQIRQIRLCQASFNHYLGTHLQLQLLREGDTTPRRPACMRAALVECNPVGSLSNLGYMPPQPVTSHRDSAVESGCWASPPEREDF